MRNSDVNYTENDVLTTSQIERKNETKVNQKELLEKFTEETNRVIKGLENRNEEISIFLEEISTTNK